MSAWKEYNITDVCDTISDTYKDGATKVVLVNTSDVLEGKVTNHEFVPNKNLAGQFKKKFQKDDILYSEIRPANRRYAYVDFEPKDYIASTKLMVLRSKPCILPKYLYYLLTNNTTIHNLHAIAVGRSGTFPQITYSELANIKFRLPSLDEQDEILTTLLYFDDKIAVNRRICENLETQAQALFKHWFIDFAPFKNGKFVESELGIIPDGWRVGRLDEYVDNLSGYSYKGNELQPSTTAMATIKNFVRGGGFKIEGYKEIVISKNIKKYQYVNLFDVLVAHTDLTQNAEVVGNPAIILSTAGYEKLIMSMDLTKVVSKDARITPPLLHSILSTRKFKEHALGYVNGTTVLHMSKKAVPEYKLVMPKNLDTLKELTSVLDNLYNLMSETYAEYLRLSTLRDTLLPKLMSGQIKV